MTVFMGPRTNYQVGRYSWHSKFAWLAVIMMLVWPSSLYLGHKKKIHWPILNTSLMVLALCTRSGRHQVARCTSEGFYGALFTFTGVFQTGSHGNRSV